MNYQSTILVVDDDTAGRESLKGALLSQGYNIIEAEHGLQGIELAREHMPDLILLDVMMPGMDGFETCQAIRNDPILREVPILLITALDDRDSRLQGIESGADDFISKPYDRVELRTRVRTVTRLNRYRRLLLERARFVWVVDHDRDGYLILDEEGKINYANDAARKMLFLPADQANSLLISFIDLVEKHFSLVPPEKWTSWPVFLGPEEIFHLVKPQSEDMDEPLWLEVQALVLPWLGKNQHLLRVRDVSKSISHTIETWSFQAAVNHKLKTPLSNMLISLQLMRTMTPKNCPPEWVEWIDTMQLGAKRLHGEIEDILQYVSTPDLVNGVDLFSLDSFEELLYKTAAELAIHSVHFSCTSPEVLKCGLPVSGQGMQVLLWEILENAKKFHPEHNPTLEVALLSQPEPKVMINFQDNGKFIPHIDLDKVLSPYFQSEKGFSGEVAGMGLGLSSVAALVWQVGGNIRIRNRTDRPGTVVELTIPLACGDKTC